MAKTVVPKKLLPDLSRIDPKRYENLPERMSPEQQAHFLDLLCHGADQLHACEVMGIPLLLVWRERHANDEFDQWLEYVTSNARPRALEEIAIRFATRGIPKRETKRVTKPIIVEGMHLGDAVEESVTESNEFNSHSLLQFLLRGQQREKYGTEHKKLEANVNTQPVALRENEDAKRVLERVKAELAKAMRASAVDGEVLNDGEDLV